MENILYLHSNMKYIKKQYVLHICDLYIRDGLKRKI